MRLVRTEPVTVHTSAAFPDVVSSDEKTLETFFYYEEEICHLQ